MLARARSMVRLLAGRLLTNEACNSFGLLLERGWMRDRIEQPWRTLGVRRVEAYYQLDEELPGGLSWPKPISVRRSASQNQKLPWVIARKANG
jgi:hypothetical protein